MVTHRDLLAPLALLLGLAGTAFPRSALAQESDALAVAQFEKGVAELEAGRYAIACPALAESFRLDPRPGALFTLAECEMKWGKTASALAHYEDYVRSYVRLSPDQQVRHKDRLTIASAQANALRTQVAQLTLTLRAPAPSGVVVKRDDVVLGAPSLGMALPIDPGEHVIVVELGGVVRRTKVVLAKGESRSIELEVPSPPNTPSNEAAAPREERDRPPSATSSRRTWAYVSFGVGAAGIATGAVFGTLVLGKKHTIDLHCAGAACDADGLAAADSARTLGLASTIGFGVGLAGVVAGTLLLLTEPSRPNGVSRRTPSTSLWYTAGGANAPGATAGLQGVW